MKMETFQFCLNTLVDFQIAWTFETDF